MVRQRTSDAPCARACGVGLPAPMARWFDDARATVRVRGRARTRARMRADHGTRKHGRAPDLKLRQRWVQNGAGNNSRFQT